MQSRLGRDRWSAAGSIVLGVEQGERVTLARTEVRGRRRREGTGPLEIPLILEPIVVEDRLPHTVTDVAALGVDDERASAVEPEVGLRRLLPRLIGVLVEI